MQADERLSREDITRQQSSEPLPLLSDDIWIAAMAAAFLLFHILVGVTFLAGKDPAPRSEQEATSPLYEQSLIGSD
jgi:hypothetical protein